MVKKKKKRKREGKKDFKLLTFGDEAEEEEEELITETVKKGKIRSVYDIKNDGKKDDIVIEKATNMDDVELDKED